MNGMGDVRLRSLLLALCAAALAPASPAALHARSVVPATEGEAALRAEIAKRAGSDMRSFYAQRDNRPLWIAKDGTLPAAQALLGQLETAEFDRLKPRKLKTSALARALERARSHEVVALLAEQAHRSNVAVVMVTHDHDVLEHCDEVFEMVDGKLSALETVAA